ncbi:MAG: HD domain-containing protein [Ectothiorhodospiraceae bacterium]|nr:HD domain-containing protein [Chromatiales bacterium]MCP5154234.1 HD domain-containing protein [Ectothiorhodospiraceae bacterium]
MFADSLDALFDLLAARGGGAYGLASVSQLEHALQAAALAEKRALGDHLVIAALFHDVGHLVPEEDVSLADQGVDDRHEEVGARMLEAVFGPEVVEPVRLHVEAKRYLCATRAGYQERLSDDSVRSLALQGGPHDAVQAARFATSPHAESAVELRQLDEGGKVPGRAVPGLDHYRAVARRIALRPN